MSLIGKEILGESKILVESSKVVNDNNPIYKVDERILKEKFEETSKNIKEVFKPSKELDDVLDSLNIKMSEVLKPIDEIILSIKMMKEDDIINEYLNKIDNEKTLLTFNKKGTPNANITYNKEYETMVKNYNTDNKYNDKAFKRFYKNDYYLLKDKKEGIREALLVNAFKSKYNIDILKVKSVLEGVKSMDEGAKTMKDNLVKALESKKAKVDEEINKYNDIIVGKNLSVYENIKNNIYSLGKMLSELTKKENLTIFLISLNSLFAIAGITATATNIGLTAKKNKDNNEKETKN